MFKYRKVLKFLNHAAYLASAVMMMAGLFLTVTTKPVSAEPVNAVVKIYWCHFEPNGNWQTLHLPLSALSGHVDANGNILHAGDHPGMCETAVPPTPTFTDVPPTPTNTDVPPTPTFTDVPPTPTNTDVPPTPTFTDVPPTPTFTDVPPTPTNTDVPPTPTFTDVPPTPTFTDVPPTPTVTPDSLYVLLLDPYCVSIPGTLMQWVVINNNAESFTVDSWSIDGVMQAGGFVVPVGVNLLTQTSLGIHTIVLYWENQGFTALTYGPLSCQLPDTATPIPTNTSVPPTSTPVQDTATPVPTLPIPETGGAGGPIIPVTGADLNQSVNSWFFGGFGMFGFGLVFSGLRKMYNL